MSNDPRRPASGILWGLFFGAAAWSAYAVAEFLFTSVVYRLTRPYAVFTAWHWRLTAEVVAGYLVCGLAIGAISAMFRRRGSQNPERYLDPLEAAPAATLVLALILNLITGPGAISGGGVQLAAAAVFLGLLILGARAVTWRRRIGWAANPWVISFTWLGTGLAFSILRMRLGSQLGKRLDLAAAGLFAGVLALVILAAWLGRRYQDRWRTGYCAVSCTAGVMLLLVSLGLSIGGGTVAEAHSNGASGGGRHPNLLLIVMDTVRADHLSLQGYGRDTTPRLKALAQDSVVYQNAFSASDITLTSHASLFTGMYPSWHGSYSQPPSAPYGRELSRQYPTLAELLDKNGYDTVGVAANLYLRADFGLERGFEQFRIPRPVPMLPDEDRYVLRYQLRRGLSFFVNTAQFDRLYTFAEDVNRELFSALDARKRPSAPFFAFVNYMDAHYPYVPPAPYDSRFPGKVPRMTGDDLGVDIDVISKGQGQPAEYRPHCESQYDGGIAYIDAQIGQVVDWLKRRGAYDNTMIVVTSDHGEAFGEKNRVGHANSPYQSLLHTALLIKYPGQVRRGVEAAPVSLIDVAPTALDVLGVAGAEAMQGMGLRDGAAAPRRIYAETFRNPVSHSPDCPEGCLTKVLVEWPLKFIENRTNRKREMFDLSVDQSEEHNLVATQPERADEMAAHLGEWTKSLPAQGVEVKRLNPAIENTLRGNGYVAK